MDGTGYSSTSVVMQRSKGKRQVLGGSHGPLDKATIMITAATAKALPQHQAHYTATPVTALRDIHSVRGCERALHMFLTQRGDAFAEIERVLADDAASVFGHCLRAALIVRAESGVPRSALAASVAAIEAACPDTNDPARYHARAARTWLQGDSVHAVALYDAILTVHPHDVLALATANALDFHLGRRRMMRDRIAKVLPHWTAEMPAYASVLSMYAFALEENGQYRRAETIARQALALDPGHPGAIHAIAHVMEMQGRVHDGLAFLTAVEAAWREGTGLSVHLAWHRALFLLDANEAQGALALYDAQIAPAGSGDVSALTDGSALLWRLQLQDIDVGKRWRLLADRWARHNLAEARPFHVVHAIMAFVAASRPAAAMRLAEALPSHARDASSLPPEDALAAPLCEALLAFARGEYAASVELLRRVRQIADRCGGSLAQCDVIHLTFTEAALRARQARLARALVAERTARKPASRLNRLLQLRLAQSRIHQSRAGASAAFPA
jgi:tetratricopeptide (TPR) repeat protein